MSAILYQKGKEIERKNGVTVYIFVKIVFHTSKLNFSLFKNILGDHKIKPNIFISNKKMSLDLYVKPIKIEKRPKHVYLEWER